MHSTALLKLTPPEEYLLTVYFTPGFKIHLVSYRFPTIGRASVCVLGRGRDA
jgi:hypothetical protein